MVPAVTGLRRMALTNPLKWEEQRCLIFYFQCSLLQATIQSPSFMLTDWVGVYEFDSLEEGGFKFSSTFMISVSPTLSFFCLFQQLSSIVKEFTQYPVISGWLNPPFLCSCLVLGYLVKPRSLCEATAVVPLTLTGNPTTNLSGVFSNIDNHNTTASPWWPGNHCDNIIILYSTSLICSLDSHLIALFYRNLHYLPWPHPHFQMMTVPSVYWGNWRNQKRTFVSS